MRRAALILVAIALASCGTTPEPVALSCVTRANSCGCSIIVEDLTCPAGGAHFFHELNDGAPLQLRLGPTPVTATSTRAVSNSFTPAPGESWTERYRYSGGEVEIRYAPGNTTCEKLSQGEQCEYFDVRAEVLLISPRGNNRFLGTGSCGC